MSMNTNIPMMGRGMNALNSLSQGQALGRAERGDNLFREHGAGIVAGDQNALAKYAQFDPQAATAIKAQHQQAEFNNERLQILRQNARTAAMKQVAQLDANQAAQAKERLTGILRGAIPLYKEGNQEGYNQWLAQNGVDPSKYAFEQFPSHAATIMGELDAFEEAKPLSGAGKLAADLNAGLITQEQFDAANAPKQPLVQNFIGGESSGEGVALPVEPTTADVPDGSGRDAFGMQGLFENFVNAGADFIAGYEPYGDTAEAARYFKSAEEEGLVAMAQAYPRMPATQQMERLRALLPQIGKDGPESALKKMRLQLGRFERDLGNAIRMQGRGTASQQQAVAKQILGLQGMIQIANEGIRLLDASGGSLTVSDDDVNLMEQLLGGE
jgi:hypothetical protein